MGARFSFDILFYLNPLPLKKKKKHLDREVTKKQGNDMQQGLDIVWLWNISSRRFDAMLFDIQQGEF